MERFLFGAALTGLHVRDGPPTMVLSRGNGRRRRSHHLEGEEGKGTPVGERDWRGGLTHLGDVAPKKELLGQRASKGSISLGSFLMATDKVSLTYV